VSRRDFERLPRALRPLVKSERDDD
jgi:hypothetical protein